MSQLRDLLAITLSIMHLAQFAVESIHYVSSYALQSDLYCGSADPDSLELVFGELVGNVVRHAPGRVHVRAVAMGDAVRLTVADGGPGFNAMMFEPPYPLTESGRGLMLVRGLSRSVPISIAPGGGTIIDVIVPFDV